MLRTIYCTGCGFLNKTFRRKKINCPVCRRKLSDSGEIETPAVVEEGLGNFILREDVSRCAILADIQVVESNRQTLHRVIRGLKKAGFSRCGVWCGKRYFMNLRVVSRRLQG